MDSLLRIEFFGLLAAAILTGALANRRSAERDWAATAPSFVVAFASLLLLGSTAAILVATAATVTQALANARPSRQIRRVFLNCVVATLPLQSAGVVYLALGGTAGPIAWPWQAAPIAAAVVGYCLVASALTEIIGPLFMGQTRRQSWLTSFLSGCPTCFIGAAVAAGIVEMIVHRAWEVVPAVAVPLYFAARAHRVHEDLREEERRRRDIAGSLDHGMCVIDTDRRVTLWDSALARILGCPREHAIDRALIDAVPALRKTEIPRAIDDALTRGQQADAQVALPSADGSRILHVSILPAAGGATLLWDDVTERTRAEQALKRSEERLALAAEGANDGLWAWDLRTQELFFSARWRSMIGLPTVSGVGRADEWIDRVHPDDIASLKETLNAHLDGKTDRFQHEHRVRHEDGTYRRFLCRGVAMRGAGRRPARIAGSFTDPTGRVIPNERLRSAGSLDPLTGLCNRAVFVEQLGRRVEELKQRRTGNRFAALYLDLDRFKIVNDSLGHLVGDELLIAISRRLESCLRPGDALARLGGDEFAILLNELGDGQQANAIAFRIQSVLSAPFSIGGREVFTSASIGIAFGTAEYDNPDEIMRDADTAMYHAKSRGKARHELFDADMHARALDRVGFENDLRHAVDQRDFEVHYQPIVSLASGMCVGFESLVRWNRNGKPVSPAVFIPIAEELGLIETLGTWVLQQACATFGDWQRRFSTRALEFITVNVSSRQLVQQNFFGIVEQAIEAAGVKPSELRLEITETGLMDNPTAVANLLRELRDFGVKIYLDDFGTGYSSLSHLHTLPVDALKIDRSFVNSLMLPDRPAIVESILALAQTLNTSVVAEGIETEMQARELERLGCTHAQGYLFSRPLSAAAAEQVIVVNQPLGPKKLRAAFSIAV